MKKIISMLIAVVMVASLFTVIAIPASAAEATTYASLYTGEADTSWYDKNDIKEEYHITTADQLAGLSYLVGWDFVTFEGVTIYLDTDIVWNTGKFTVDANGAPLYNDLAIDTTDAENHKAGDEVLKFWEPIGDREQDPANAPGADGQFYGSFDGQGHTISGLYTNSTTAAYAGLFAVFCGKELKNVSIVNSYFGAESRSGSFAGFVYNTSECGENRDVVGARLSNLYSDAYIHLYCGKSANNARSGGIVGMTRPKNLIDGQKPVTNGSVTIIENCWYNGQMSFVDSNVRYSGGILGVAALDSAENGPSINEVIIQNCLFTGSFINYGLADTALSNGEGRAEGCRIGSVAGNIYKGKLTLKNVVVAMDDTNITAENGYAGTSKNEDTNETTVLAGKAPVGTLENDPSEVVYENVFINAKGLFVDGTSVITIAEEARDHVGITGNYTTDADLALALVSLGGTDSAFDLSNLSAPALKNVKTTCDPVNPEDLKKPEPPANDTTDPSNVTTEDPGDVTTEDPNNGGEDDPVVTTTKAPTTTVPSTTAASGGCSGFTAFAAVLALVAVSAAAVVIKKK